MKTASRISLMFVFLLAMMTAFAGSTQTASFKVSGNCGTCKKHIEGALVRQPGIEKAVWNKDSKLIKVVYDPAVTSIDAMQKKIAAVGYDTPKYKADEKAYQQLDACCQYDRKG